MKKVASKIFLVFALIGVCFLPLFLAQAQVGTPQTGSGEWDDDPFVQTLENVKSYLLTFGGVVAVIFIIAGALMLMAGGGDSKRVETGKSMIMYSIIGLAIIFMANAIISALENVLVTS